MGEFFFFYPKQQIARTLAMRGFVAVRGRKPVKTSIRVDELDDSRNLLVVATETDESGSFYIPCSDGHDGFFYASTEPLPSSRRQVPLYLELCRGQLSRIQHKRGDWTPLGFVTPPKLKQQIHAALHKFSTLVTTDYSEPDFDARTVALFAELQEIARKLNEHFLSLTLAARRRTTSWGTRFGISVGANDDWTTSYDALFVGGKGRHAHAKLDPVFNSIMARVNWRDTDNHGVYDWSMLDKSIRAARSRDLRVTVGPLIRWADDLPPRLLNSAGDKLRAEYERYLNSALESIGARVARWIVASNLETAPSIQAFEFRLSIALMTATAIRQRFPRAQVFLGFEQAFGDATRFGIPAVVSPVELAARLAQRRVFDGYYLEANFGLTPYTTAPRDPMELHRFFDRWAACGAKLAVATSCPSASPADVPTSPDPADLLTSALGEKPKRSFFFRSHSESKTLEELVWSPQIQQELARRFYSSALARKAVDELIWTRWVDDQPMAYDEYVAATNFYDHERSATLANLRAEMDDVDLSDVYDDVQSIDDEEILPDAPDNQDEIFDEIDLVSDGSSFTASESVETRHSPESPENYTPTSGLIGSDNRAKPTLHKLAALQRAYLEQ